MTAAIDFNPTDRILAETRLKLDLARQHLATFQDIGITSQWLDDLAKAADEAEQLPTYTDQQDHLHNLIFQKDEALDHCIQWGRKLHLRMQIIFTARLISNTPFPTQSWNAAQTNEAIMISLFPTFLQIAQDNSEVLATAGQTDKDIETGQTLFDNLKAASAAPETYKRQSITISQTRRRIYRYLYDGINRINQASQPPYGRDTAKKQRFHNNWNRSRSVPAALEAVTITTAATA